MARSGKPGSADGQQSLGELVALATRDISQLLRYEISLAKSELRMDARRIGIAAALAVIGLFVLCLLVVLLCFAFAYGLVAAGIWQWAAFLIVAGTCLLLVVLAGLIAWSRIRKVTGMKMTRKTVVDDLSLLRRGEPSPDGAGPVAGKDATSVGPGGKGTGIGPGGKSTDSKDTDSKAEITGQS